MKQFFTKSQFNEEGEVMLKNTDIHSNGALPYLTGRRRKRYLDRGAELYNKKQAFEANFGVPNPWHHAHTMAEKDRTQNGSDDEEADKSENDYPKEEEIKDLYPGDPDKLPDDKEKEDEEETDNILQVVAAEKQPQDEVEEMPCAEYVGKPPFRMILSGVTGSGKSTVLTYLINKFYSNYFTQIWVFAKTLKEDPVWREARLDRDLMFEEYHPEIIDAIERKQHDYIKEHGIASADKILILVDDFASDYRVMHNHHLSNIFFYGRKKNISVAIITQKYNEVAKKNRLNAGIIICFPTGNNAEMEALQNEQRSPYFPSGVRGNYAFDQIYRFCTLATDDIDEYPFMVINHMAKDKKDMYRKRLGGVVQLKVNPQTHMVDCDFTQATSRKQRAAAEGGSSETFTEPVAKKRKQR